MTKALALLSGGLDSTLAIHVIRQQGIEVEALNFLTVFCRCTSTVGCKLEAKKVSESVGIPIRVINMTESFLEIVKNPEHGYGSNVNPCIDCRIHMFRVAGDYMREVGASFIITGEVLGQRPMSQRRDAMRTIDREADLEGLILRPLSAKWLEPTIPEKEGLVDREKLLDIQGRSRKPQMQLADVFQLKDYPCPAGGCLLTDPGFARRMKDLLDHGDPTVNDVHLLKIGRHFRLDEKTKVIIGREHSENKKINTLSKESDFLLQIEGIPGPLSLLRAEGAVAEGNIKLAAQLTARYSTKTHALEVVPIMVGRGRAQGGYGKSGEDQARIIEVQHISAAEADKLMITGPLKEKKKRRR